MAKPALTEAIQDYLREIYKLGADGARVSVTALAKRQGVTRRRFLQTASGMAAACKLDTKPVLHAFRDLMDRKQMQGKERKRLVGIVSQSHDRAFATQQRPGAMSCPEVRDQMRSTIRRLQRAK